MSPHLASSRAVQETANGRIAALDGVRGVSIVLVLCAHTLGTGILPTGAAAHVLADLGVRSFFVVSGFLITTLLLRERGRRGQISLRGFYLRRSLRIFPAFYAYLGVVVALRAIGWVAASDRDLAFAATYTMNFHAERAWSVGHLWSLAVEEQFYVLWPITLVVLRTRGALVVALAAIATAPVVRTALWYHAPALQALTDQAFPCVFDTLATGCVLAISRGWLEASARYRRALASRWFWAIPVGCACALLVTRPWFSLGISMTLANAGVALTIHRCVWRPSPAVTRVLEHPAMIRVGVLSYSLYLWQQLFLNRHSTSWIAAFPVNAICVAIVAAVSYRWIETPFLRLSAHLTRRKSSLEATTATLPVLAPRRATATITAAARA